MITLENFYSILESATTVDEEGFDIRFEEIVSLVDQEKMDEATSLIDVILKEGTVDIRLVMYQFYAQFISQGISCIKVLFPTIIQMHTDYWDKLSPVRTREKYFVSSLTWLLSSIVKKLKRAEKLIKENKPDEFWTKVIDNLSESDIEKLAQVTHELIKFIAQTLKQPSINQYALYIPKWLGGLKTPPAEEIKKAISPKAFFSTSEKSKKKQVSLDEILTSSEPMIHLFRKIQAFESLIENENFEKAALVSDDIAQILKSFDPSFFFPKLFSRYFSLSAEYVDALSQEWENKGSLKWEALNRLYQTDLEEFIQW